MNENFELTTSIYNNNFQPQSWCNCIYIMLKKGSPNVISNDGLGTKPSVIYLNKNPFFKGPPCPQR